jgi:succinate dehydrogenase / fumarate reductase cytochrome b subunit
MGLTRNVGLATALRYKGQGPMWTYVLHRLGGLGMAIFVTTHLLATFLGGEAGQSVNAIYESWIFQVFMFFFVLFHAINGLRITILDLFPKLLPHLREAIWVEMAVFLPVYLSAVFIIVRNGLGG